MAMNKRQLQKKGPKGHKLAHITPLEGVILKALGGSGKVNPNTGIRSYGSHLGHQQGDDDDTDTYDSSKDELASSGTGGTKKPGGVLEGGVVTTKKPVADTFGGEDSGGADPATIVPVADDLTGGIDTGGLDPTGGPTGDEPWFKISDEGDTQRAYETDKEYADRENPMFSNLELAVMRGKNPKTEGETDKEYNDRIIKKAIVASTEDGGDDSDDTQPPETFCDSKGICGLTQAQVNTNEATYTAAAAALKLAKDTKLGEIEGFGYGDDGTFSGTEYASTYKQMLADAYSAAQRGSNREIMQLGYDPGTGVTETDLTGQKTWLTGLGTDYQAKNKAMYDTWYGENMAKIKALGSKADVDAYVWTPKPAYDLDYTGGSASGTDKTAEGYVYDPDYIPEFFEGFKKEFEPGYSSPTMPAEWGGHPEGYVAPGEEVVVEDGDGSVESLPILESPALKRRRTKRAYVGLSPFSGGSGRII